MSPPHTGKDPFPGVAQEGEPGAEGAPWTQMGRQTEGCRVLVPAQP